MVARHDTRCSDERKHGSARPAVHHDSGAHSTQRWSWKYVPSLQSAIECTIFAPPSQVWLHEVDVGNKHQCVEAFGCVDAFGRALSHAMSMRRREWYRMRGNSAIRALVLLQVARPLVTPLEFRPTEYSGGRHQDEDDRPGDSRRRARRHQLAAPLTIPRCPSGESISLLPALAFSFAAQR